MVYADAARPAWVSGFTVNTFNAMIAGAKDGALAAGLITPAAWDRGLADLAATAGPDGHLQLHLLQRRRCLLNVSLAHDPDICARNSFVRSSCGA